MGIKRKVKTLLRKTKYFFSAKYAVNIPVLYGELLKGRTALITGGTSGIGYAIADAFMRNGADVVITGRSQDRIDKACEALNKSNPNNKAAGAVLNNCNIKGMPEAFEKVKNLAEGGYRYFCE